MDLKARFGRNLVVAGLAVFVCGCSTVEYRTAATAIEVIESNYIESTNDAEIVHVETPSRKVAALRAANAS